MKTAEITLYDETAHKWLAGYTKEKFNDRLKGETQYKKAKEYLENIDNFPYISHLADFIESKKIEPVLKQLHANGVIIYYPGDRICLKGNKVRCKRCFSYDNKAFWLYAYDMKEHFKRWHHADDKDFDKGGRHENYEQDFTTEPPIAKTEHKWSAPYTKEGYRAGQPSIEIVCEDCGKTQTFYPTYEVDCEGKQV